MEDIEDYSILSDYSNLPSYQLANSTIHDTMRRADLDNDGVESYQALRLAYDNLKLRYNELYEKQYVYRMRNNSSFNESRVQELGGSQYDLSENHMLSPYHQHSASGINDSRLSPTSYDETDGSRRQFYEEKLDAYKQVLEKLEQQNSELLEQNETLEDNIRYHVEQNKELRNQIKELENNMRAQRRAKEKNLEKERDINETLKPRATQDFTESNLNLPELQKIATSLSHSEKEMKILKDCVLKQNQIIRMLLARYRSMDLNKDSLQNAINFVNDVNSTSPEAAYIGEEKFSNQQLLFKRNMSTSGIIASSGIAPNFSQCNTTENAPLTRTNHKNKIGNRGSSFSTSTLLKNLRRCDSNGRYLPTDEESINLMPENYRLYNAEKTNHKYTNISEFEPQTMISNDPSQLDSFDAGQTQEDIYHTARHNTRFDSNYIFNEPSSYQEPTLDLSHIEPGINILSHTCPICNMKFPPNTSREDFHRHVTDCVHSNDDSVENQNGKLCPMCNKRFDEGISQQEFETHVNTHFEDTIETIIDSQFEVVD